MDTRVERSIILMRKAPACCAYSHMHVARHTCGSPKQQLRARRVSAFLHTCTAIMCRPRDVYHAPTVALVISSCFIERGGGLFYRDMARLVFQPQALRKTGCAPMRESDLIITPAPAFEKHEAMSQSICRMREVLRRLSTTTDV